MRPIKPDRLRFETIREKAEDFRKEHVKPNDLIPVPIEKIIEFNLNLNIIPEFGLKQEADIEGVLLSDLKTILVDNSTYIDERFHYRLRFTLAHEVGHLVLHEKQYKRRNFSTVQEWIEFQQDIDSEDLEWFEKQAHEFAGRLLAPVQKLYDYILIQSEYCEKYKSQLLKIEEDFNDREVMDLLIEGVASKIYPKFAVSKDVIKKRIRKEKLNLEFDFLNI